MSRGQRYWNEFTDWYLSLDESEQRQYAADHPEPADWKYFYQVICHDITADPQGWDRLYQLVQKNWKQYQKNEYALGRQAEDARDLLSAIDHYHNVEKHGDYADAEQRLYRLQDIVYGP